MTTRNRRIQILGIALGLLLGLPAMAWAATTWTLSDPPFHTSATVPYGVLNSVTAISTGDVWSVGQINGVPLIEHNDGAKWRTVSLPSGPCSAFESDCVLT